MHDPTEGGLAGALHELADAAKVGFNVYEKKIFVPEETRKICNHFDIDPFQLISSGSLLIIAREEKEDQILDKLSKNGVQAALIGEVIKPNSGRNLITKTGKETELVRPINDHLWKALAKPVKT